MAKISQQPQASAITGAETLLIVQDAATRRVTLDALLATERAAMAAQIEAATAAASDTALALAAALAAASDAQHAVTQALAAQATAETDKAAAEAAMVAAHSAQIAAEAAAADARAAAASVTPTLSAFTLSAATIVETSPAGTMIGAIAGGTTGAAYSLFNDAGGRFALSGTNLVAGATPTDFEAFRAHSITVKASKAGFPDLFLVFDISVTNLFEQPALGNIALSAGTVAVGTPSSGTVTGSTAGATIAVTGLPPGLTIDLAARTWAYDGSGGAGAFTLNWTQTLDDSPNSGHQNQFNLTITAVGTALEAPAITRTTGPTVYPPQVLFERPMSWQDGDKAVMQWSSDWTFATGVSETAAPVTITAAVTNYDFGLSAITSGSKFIRMAAWRGSRPASLTWSNTVNVGDTVAPSITSAATATLPERDASGVATVPSIAITFDEPCTATLAGADAALWAISNATVPSATAQLTMAAGVTPDFETKPNHALTITGADLAGNVSAAQNFAVTVTNTVENPTAFTFNAVSNAPVSTQYTSNIVTIAGLPASYQAPYALTTADGIVVLKNGVVAANTGTVGNGDTLALRGTSKATNNASSGASLSVGGDSPAVAANWAIATAMVLPRAANWTLVIDPSVASSLYQAVTKTGALAAAQGDPVGYLVDQSPNAFDLLSPSTAARPTLDLSTGYPALQYDGVDDVSYRAATLGAYAAGAATFVWAIAAAPANNGCLGAAGSSTTNNPGYIFRESTSSVGGLEAYLRNDAGTAPVFTPTNAELAGAATNALTGAAKVIIVVDTGTTMTAYIDGVAQATKTYNRADPTTFNRYSLMAWMRGTAGSFASGKINFHGVIPAVLNASEIAQLTTYAAAKQGRSL